MPETPGSPFLAHARLAELARTRGDQPFIWEAHETGEPMTIAQLHDKASRLATVLAGMGVRRGDRVHLQLSNRWEFLAAFFAASIMGAVIVPVSLRASLDEVAYSVELTQPTAGVVEAAGPEMLDLLTEIGLPSSALLAAGASAGDAVVALADAVAAASPWSGPEEGRITDLLAVLYTSGVAGWPRGVMLTQANLRHAAIAYAAAARVQPTDRILISLPLSHIAGLGNMALAALWTASSMGFTKPGPTWIRAAIRQQSTVANLSAIEVRELLAAPPVESEESVLRLVVFGPAVSTQLREEFEQRFGTELRLGYGATEAVAPIALSLPTVLPDEDYVGEALAPAALSVVDSSGAVVAAGEPGELVVSGVPGVTLPAGYYGLPELSRQVFGSGRWHSGDQVIIESDGRLRFLERAADQFKAGLTTVSATAIERVMKEHVGVADAAVVAVEKAGEAPVVVAFVELSEFHPDLGVDELAGWVATRLGDESLPGRYVVVDALPYTESGKVLKTRLVEWAAE
ncbi:MAG TPA: class I adenylate-forming enzyme family protein [Propionicimonas sp.]|nr:class I adenylate-forming enzyme family protein [Propionicimonas sp.]